MKKIIVMDYDHTFYPYNDDKFHENIKAVNEFKAAGNIVVIATARSVDDIKERQKEYDFYYDYLIGCNGSIITDNKEKVIYKSLLEEKSLEGVLKAAEENSKIINDFDTSDGYNYFADKCHFDKDNIIFYMHAVNESKLVEILKSFKDIVGVETIGCHESVYIMNEGVSKANAIKKVLEIENAENPYVIGDSRNDYNMIEKYNGYCVENATEEIKKIAKKEYKDISDFVADIMKNKV